MKMSEYLNSVSNNEEPEQVVQETAQETTVKRKRGRPRKQTVEETSGSKEETSGSKEETVKVKETSGSKEETVVKRRAKKILKDNKTPPANPNKNNNPNGSPLMGDKGLTVEEGDTNKYLMLNMELFNLPDIDLKDAQAVKTRLSEYFAIYAKYDTKPTVAGMALALGMSRKTLIAIVHDLPTGGGGSLSALPIASADFIKKSYNILENLWENYMNQGKINPVSGIFLAKNNYGYVDKQETVITPAAPAAEDYSADEIRERYIPSDSPTFTLPQTD